MNRTLSLSITLLSVVPTLAGAQVISGTLEGRVRDPQGAVLPGVTITSVHQATASKFVSVSTSEGLYRVTFLPPGNYDVTAELSGFRTETCGQAGGDLAVRYDW